MLIISTIFAPLWYPLRSQFGLIRSLCAGAELPGTNLVLVQSTKSSFCGLEKFIMALASAWLVIRLANYNFDQAEEMLKDKENTNNAICDIQHRDQDINGKNIEEVDHYQHEWQQQEVEQQQHEEQQEENQQDEEQQEEEQQEEDEEDLENISAESTEESTDSDILSSTDEGEVYYWRRQNGGHQPRLRFTSRELEMLLKVNPNASYNNNGNDFQAAMCEYEEGEGDQNPDDDDDTNTETEDTETDTDDGYYYSEVSSQEEINVDVITPIPLYQDQDTDFSHVADHQIDTVTEEGYDYTEITSRGEECQRNVYTNVLVSMDNDEVRSHDSSQEIDTDADRSPITPRPR